MFTLADETVPKDVLHGCLDWLWVADQGYSRVASAVGNLLGQVNLVLGNGLPDDLVERDHRDSSGDLGVLHDGLCHLFVLYHNLHARRQTKR